MKNEEIKGNRGFCIGQNKPLVVVVAVTLIVVIVWTISQKVTRGGDNNGGHVRHTRGGQPVMQSVANAKIPISIGQLMPHPNYGHDCLQCHSLIGKDQKAPIPAPPISAAALIPHPYWGECSKCHQNGTGQTKTVVYTDAIAGRNVMGAELVAVTPDMAVQYKLPSQNGVLVNAVERGSVAETSGFKEGDIIVKIDTKAVERLLASSAIFRVSAGVLGSGVGFCVYETKKEKIA